VSPTLNYPIDPVWEMPKNYCPTTFFKNLGVIEPNTVICCIEHGGIENKILEPLKPYLVNTLFVPNKNTTWPKSQFYFISINLASIAELVKISNSQNICDYADHVAVFTTEGTVLIDAPDFCDIPFYLNSLSTKQLIRTFVEKGSGKPQLCYDVYGP
jgi:hypothetical protein